MRRGNDGDIDKEEEGSDDDSNQFFLVDHSLDDSDE